MATIAEDYVSFETAKLLKDKVFDEATNRYYNAQYDQIRTVSDTFLWHWNNEEFMKRVSMDGAIAIPTLQMAMKWLREVYNLQIIIIPIRTKQHKNWTFEIYKEFNPLTIHVFCFSTYEEACEAGITYCIEHLI